MKIIFLFLTFLLCACHIPIISPQQQNCADINVFNNPFDATFDRNELCGIPNNGLMNSGNSGFIGL